MKLEWLWDFKINEVEGYAWVSMIVGAAMFIIGLAWDKLVGVHVQHSEGLGLMQIVWLSFWGLYTLYGWMIQDKWGE